MTRPTSSGAARFVLGLEVLFGVLPITIIGGGYAIFGLLFGSVSVLLALRAQAFEALALWLGILGLAAGGGFGIAGLWALVAISAGFRSPSLPMTRLAVLGSLVGVLVGVVVIVLMVRGTWTGSPWVLYILVAPILVVLHRCPAITRLL